MVKTEAAASDWKFRQTAAQFARSGYGISGHIASDLLSRATEDGSTVSDVYATVAALIAAERSRSGFTVSVSGRMGLTCQSCGAAFELPVESASTIYVAKDAAELDSWEEESFESIEANEKTSALELVEDELLLAVPYVPRCQACSADNAPKVHEFN
jgi:uncharacterized protein